MGSSGRSLALILILIIAISSLSLMIIKPANAQSSSTATAPTFTFKFVDNSYYVSPTTTSTTDPYTGNVTTTTIPGHYVENKTIEAIITNNLGASYYNFRDKGHYSDEWSYYPSDPNSVDGYNHYDAYSVPCQANSSSSYTEISLSFLPTSVPVGGQVDVQVQALFGNYNAIPYGHITPLPAPTYDFIFNGTVSDWSSTQTLTYNGTDFTTSMEATPSLSPLASSSPTVPEFPLMAIPLLLSILLFALILRMKKHRIS
jgi:hypothetical protein